MQGCLRKVRQRILALRVNWALRINRGTCFLGNRCVLWIFLLGALTIAFYQNVRPTRPESTPSLESPTRRGFVWKQDAFSSNTSSFTTSGTFSPPDTWTLTTPEPATYQIVPTTADSKVLENSFRRYLVEYPSEYHFVINEEKSCEEAKPFVVLIIPVAAANREHRDIIRSTWGGVNLVLGKVVRHFFLVGLHGGDDSQQIQQQLLNESQQHHDLIQSDFVDCYKNLTIKTMVMMEWLDRYCANASYAMKVDSDTFLNVKNLVKILLKAPRRNYMTGRVDHDALVQRNSSSKWSLPKKLLPRKAYPPYAIGLGYILSLDLPKKLVGASRHVQAIYIEDVYLGLCMEYLNISLSQPPVKNQFMLKPVKYQHCAYSKIIVTLNLPSMNPIKLWKNFTALSPKC